MSSITSSTGAIIQSPVQSSPVQSSPVQSSPVPSTDVPKGQLNRTRDKLPTGWSNDGGHNGFKAANISQSPEGLFLAAVRAADVPRGRQ